jgi:hypothetical protein
MGARTPHRDRVQSPAQRQARTLAASAAGEPRLQLQLVERARGGLDLGDVRIPAPAAPTHPLSRWRIMALYATWSMCDTFPTVTGLHAYLETARNTWACVGACSDAKVANRSVTFGVWHGVQITWQAGRRRRETAHFGALLPQPLAELLLELLLRVDAARFHHLEAHGRRVLRFHRGHVRVGLGEQVQRVDGRDGGTGCQQPQPMHLV